LSHPQLLRREIRGFIAEGRKECESSDVIYKHTGHANGCLADVYRLKMPRYGYICEDK